MVASGQVLLRVLFAWKIDYLHSIIWNSDWLKLLGNDCQSRTPYGLPLLMVCTFACSPSNHAFFISPASRDQMESTARVIQLPIMDSLGPAVDYHCLPSVPLHAAVVIVPSLSPQPPEVRWTRPE